MDSIIFETNEMKEYGLNSEMIPSILGSYLHYMGGEPIYTDKKPSGYKFPGFDIEFSHEEEGFTVGLIVSEQTELLEKIVNFLQSRKEHPDYISQNFHAMWLED